MVCLPLLGLIFMIVMSTYQETSDSDIFLGGRVIVSKYLFKSNPSDPLCEIVSK